VRVSPDFGTGAPVVMSDVKIPDNQLGRIDRATVRDGTKIPVRYAVMDASQILTSHDVNGSTRPDYANPEVQGVRAIAGNGRIAGIAQAYNRGLAQPYTDALTADVDHGISADVIKSMKNPVLVRIMPKSFVTTNIGDLSNVSGVAELSPVEKAKNDYRRIDIEGLQFNEDGSFSDNTLEAFIRSMPDNERGGLRLPDGRPNSAAAQRLNNAIFYNAYNSEPLIDLYAQAIDPEAKIILSGLAQAASKFARLEGAGEYDIRQVVANAAEQAVNARRRGVPLGNFANQLDMGIDEKTRKVIEMMANNSRSAKKIGEQLSALANAAYDQTQTGEDLFGATPKRTVDELFDDLLGVPGEVKPKEPKPPSEPPEPVLYEIKKTPAEIEKEIYGMTIPELMQWAVNNAPTSVARKIAQAIQKKMAEYDNRDIYGPGRGYKVKILKDDRRRRTEIGAVILTPYTTGVRIEMRLNGTVNGKADSLG